MMNYDITERGSCSTHSHVKFVLRLLSNIIIHHQNYHGITDIAKISIVTLHVELNST